MCQAELSHGSSLMCCRVEAASSCEGLGWQGLPLQFPAQEAVAAHFVLLPVWSCDGDEHHASGVSVFQRV